MPRQTPTTATTAVVLKSDQLALLRKAALCRSLVNQGARTSVSDIVREAIDAYTDRLRAETDVFGELPRPAVC